MREKVLNFGSLNLDYVYQVDHILQQGETLSSSGMNVFCGGKGLNQSVALAKANVVPYHAGSIGEDGDVLIEFLGKNGMDATYINRINGKSGHTIIQVDGHGQNCILVYAGANRGQSRSHIDRVLKDFGKGDYILLQNEINELDYIIREAFEREMKVILNPSPIDHHLWTCDLEKVHLFIMNELEGEALTDCKEPQDVLREMKKRYPNAAVLLTLGDKGAYYSAGNNIYYQKIVPTKAVDTTAAGDTFTGYFIAGLIDKLTVEENLQRCAKAASITVSREGAAQSIPTLEEVWKG